VEAVKRRKIFRDVVRGYSSTILDEDFVYIKHLTPHDQVELEEIEEKYFNAALRRGVPTEEEMLAFLKEEGDWGDKDEKFIEDKEYFLETLKTAKTKMVIKNQIDKQEKTIKKKPSH